MSYNPYDGKHDKLLMRAVHGELNRWGKWHEARLDYEGYPTKSPYADSWFACAPRVGKRTLTANGKQSAISSTGHRVLMLDMPTEVWATHHRVIGLPEEWQRVINAHYVHTIKEDLAGNVTTWTLLEKCSKLNVSRETYGQILRLAKRRIAGLDGDKIRQVECVVRWA